MEQADHQSNNAQASSSSSAQASSSSSRLDAIKRLLAEKFKFTETRGIRHAAELERIQQFENFRTSPSSIERRQQGQSRMASFTGQYLPSVRSRVVNFATNQTLELVKEAITAAVSKYTPHMQHRMEVCKSLVRPEVVPALAQDINRAIESITPEDLANVTQLVDDMFIEFFSGMDGRLQRFRERLVPSLDLKPIDCPLALQEMITNGSVVVPEELRCPISMDLISVPVRLADSPVAATYDYASISRHITELLESGQDVTCPSTGLKLPPNNSVNAYLRSCASIRVEITQWIEQQSHEQGLASVDTKNESPIIEMSQLPVDEPLFVELARRIKPAVNIDPLFARAIKLNKHEFSGIEQVAQADEVVAKPELTDPFTGKLMTRPVLLVDGTRIDLSTLGKYKAQFQDEHGQIIVPNKNETYGTDWANFLNEIKDDHLARSRVEHFIAQQQSSWLNAKNSAPGFALGSMLDQLARSAQPVLEDDQTSESSKATTSAEVSPVEAAVAESSHEHDYASTMPSSSVMGLFAQGHQIESVESDKSSSLPLQ